MTLTVQPAVELPMATLCDIINRSFKGYVGGDFQFTLPVLATFLAQVDVHLARSLVVLQDGEPAGIAMLARRGWAVRVALMGVITEFQNQGVGRWLLGHIMEAAKAAGDRTMVLEVIEQNPRAVHLYEVCGFRRVQRLVGYDYKVDNGEKRATNENSLRRVDVLEAARHMTAWEAADIPWQFSGIAVAKGGAPSVAYEVDGCYAVCSNPEAETMSLLGLAVPRDRQRKGEATRLVGRLMAAHAGQSWRVAPICPEKYGAIFLRNGFTVNALNQFQMEVVL